MLCVCVYVCVVGWWLGDSFYFNLYTYLMCIRNYVTLTMATSTSTMINIIYKSLPHIQLTALLQFHHDTHSIIILILQVMKLATERLRNFLKAT